MGRVYDDITTMKDVLDERYILGAELVGKYEFPQLPKVTGDVEGLSPVVFTEINKVKKTKQSIVHFFIHDDRFERVWNNPEKYIESLSNFKWVCSPDFTCYDNLPLAVQIHQRYKSRALAFYLWNRGVNIIPTVGWSDPKSWEWCFDGLPKDSIVAVSTNGIVGKESIKHYQEGFSAMMECIHPHKVVCIGRPVAVLEKVDIIYYDSYSMQMRKRLSDGRKRLSDGR